MSTYLGGLKWSIHGTVGLSRAALAARTPLVRFTSFYLGLLLQRGDIYPYPGEILSVLLTAHPGYHKMLYLPALHWCDGLLFLGESMSAMGHLHNDGGHHPRCYICCCWHHMLE